MAMESIEKLKEKIAKDPQSKLFVPLADEYRKTGKLDEAIDVLKKGLERQPHYMSARVALGKIYLEKAMAGEAREEFEKVIAAIPDNLYAHRKLADLYNETGDTEKALKAYKTVLKLNPLDEEAQGILKELESGIKAGAGEMVVETTRHGEKVSQAAASEEAVEEKAAEELEGVPEEAIAEVAEIPVDETIEEIPAEEISGMAPGEAEQPGVIEEEVYELEEDETLEAVGVMPEAVPESLEKLSEEVKAPEKTAPLRPGLDISQADEFIKKGNYSGAVKALRRLIEEHPKDRLILQRLEELRGLLKLLGKDKEIVLKSLESLLEGLKRRRDEFFGNT